MVLDINTKKELILKYLNETSAACKIQCIRLITLGLEELLAEHQYIDHKAIITNVNGGVSIMIDRLPEDMINEIYRIMQKKVPMLPTE